jgi:signal transduction histidine kinase
MIWSSRTRARWNSLTLATQFAIATSIVVSAFMTLLAAWVSSRIEEGVVENTAITTAFYMESLLAPLLQPLATEASLPAAAQTSLGRILAETPLGREIVTIKIWAAPSRRPSLTRVVLYSNVAEFMGATFPQSLSFKRAASGRVVKSFNISDKDENGSDVRHGVQLLEIYTPIYQHGTRRIIAIAEFYQKTETLQASIRAARKQTIFVVGAATITMLALLFGIVRQGSRTIATQRLSLEQRVDELFGALNHNEELRQNLIQATRRTGETNERLLRRVGAELHDGPAQLVGLTLLRFDAIHPAETTLSLTEKTNIFEILRGALVDAIDEIRNISSDIAPPHLGDMKLETALELAVRNHEKRTGTSVKRQFGTYPDTIPSIIKICLYRFTQEGLNNAFKHASGRGQMVDAAFHEGVICVEVCDEGPGVDAADIGRSNGLGLAGLRDRVESLDGSLEFKSVPGFGTKLIAKFYIDREVRSDG